MGGRSSKRVRPPSEGSGGGSGGGVEGPSALGGIFRRYRVELRPRVGGSARDGKHVELLARTRGAARRAAAQQHPDHVVGSITRVD